MKRGILLFLIVVTATILSQAQPCKRDSSLLMQNDSFILSPAPYTLTNPVIKSKPACVGEPYLLDVTLKVIPSFQVPGFPLVAPIDSVAIPTTGAVKNLPVGLNYTCDPPSCRFQKGSLGCIQIKGTATNPSGSVLPDTLDLGIKLTIYTPLLPIPYDTEFPGPIAPGSHFYMIFNETGQCASGTDDLAGKISSVKNVPNPFSGSTTIQVQSRVDGAFNFEVFDLVGQRIHQRQVQISEGDNQIEFDGNDLPEGLYFYRLSNREGQITKVMTIAR